MSTRQALFSVLHLFTVLSFFIGGLFFLALTYLPALKTPLFEKSMLIGELLLGSSLILLLGFYVLDRGKYLVIQMGVSVDVGVIRQTVEECFAEKFPQKLSLMDVEVGWKSRLEIKVATLPLDDQGRAELFAAAEKALTVLLRDRFGYTKPFRFIAKL